MLINNIKIIQGIIIGLCVFLCSIILIITLYLLYRYRKESNDFQEKTNSNIIEIKPNNYSVTNETTSTIIEDFMRKSLELAQTLEKVADEKEKGISLKEKIEIDLQS
ncbi:unnamed protein product [Adineta steineri]|uniref:Uncharacterized protein n=1 Tax=Adineta steineri TaxID=433720 RepID=A0A814QT03_9BILA|nr:unnamed protein product [Adineta steineri]CAF3791094.1 unnamed protein product [Adineta steineri]